MTRCPEDFGIKIVDSKFVTAIGDFPQIETEKLDRLEINEMDRELQKLILDQMLDMIESWQIPTSRVLRWFSNRSMWFRLLQQHEILFSYYEMIFLGEGHESRDIEDLSTAHPMRVASLSKFLHRIYRESAEICGETLVGIELEILSLTTGKLSVAEIAERLEIPIDLVMEVLNRLEHKHLIVYSPF